MLAKQVANTILDTLNENDNVTMIGLDAKPLVNCFDGHIKLLQVRISLTCVSLKELSWNNVLYIFTDFFCLI